MSQLISPNDNLAEGIPYSTIFAASQPGRFNWPDSSQRHFSIGFALVLRAKGRITSAKQGADRSEVRINWIMDDVPGVNNPTLDTPEVSQALKLIAEKMDAVNPKISFAGLETMALIEHEIPKGASDLAKQAADKTREALAAPFQALNDWLNKLGTGGLLIAGMLAFGLAMGLSRSRVRAAL